MERIATKRTFKKAEPEQPIEDRELAVKVFEEVLKRGQAFYPGHLGPKRDPRVYRIIPLSQS
ncbi:MAG: hypothetical protein ACO1QB_12375 [Verrucomicrobiales bacterium]